MKSLEEELCSNFLEGSEPEIVFERWAQVDHRKPVVILAEGFEERSLGFLRHLVRAKIPVDIVLRIRYIGGEAVEASWVEEYETLVSKLECERSSLVVTKDRAGKWLTKLRGHLPHRNVIIDISGLTTSLMFEVLDLVSGECTEFSVAYSEAGAYRPTFAEWNELLQEVGTDEYSDPFLAEKVDEQRWLYARPHRFSLINNHEGYDSSGLTGLVAFLPFKSSRLSALLKEIEYSHYCFIAGLPRLPENRWRRDAVQRVNQSLIGVSEVIELSTFDYKSAFEGLSHKICGPSGLALISDIHVAPFGSKLQKVACWAISTLLPSLTIVNVHTTEYHADAFSHGIGETWVFKIPSPTLVVQAATK